MKIVFVGNHSVDYSSETHHCKTLESLGHEVIRVQEGRVEGAKILSIAENADLLIWIHTHGWDTPGLISSGEVLHRLKEKGITTLTYHLDLWLGLAREKDLTTDDFYKHIQHFFSVDKLMADWFNKNTEVKGHYILAGVYDKECYIHPDYDPKNFENDIIFVGSRNYHPEWPWRPQLVDWLKETYGDRFKHYGNDGLGTVRGDALNRLYAKTKVVVGDSLCPGFDYPFYSTDRLFETTGRGGFLIYPEIPKLFGVFENRITYYKFKDLNGLKNQIDFYLENDEKREELRMEAHNHTKNNHTYVQRWQEILNKI